MSGNRNMNRAKAAKNDDFYTQLTDIEKEVRHYRGHFQDKVVYCNCDDPRFSDFFNYFSHRFESLGLKRLITTCYKNQHRDLLSRHDTDEAIYLEYNGDLNGNRVPDPEEIGVHKLQGDGDFRSDECIALLKKADIVVTNPPFSLFREYIEQLIEYDKKFLIIGHLNALTYKNVFPLVKADKIWLGASIKSGDREFGIPPSYVTNSPSLRVDENGKRFVRVPGVRWFTNLDYTKRHEDLILYENYAPQKYPKYDNYDAINVDRTKDIPFNYDGVMGVPISFFDKYNPDQFEIVGSDYEVNQGLLSELINPNWQGKLDRGYLKGKRFPSRILIRRK